MDCFEISFNNITIIEAEMEEYASGVELTFILVFST